MNGVIQNGRNKNIYKARKSKFGDYVNGKKKPLIEIQPKCPAHFFQAVFYRKDHII